jgi:hypothetical protein
MTVAAMMVAGSAAGAPPAVPPPGERAPAHPATFEVIQPAGGARAEAVRTSMRSLRGRVVVLAFTDDRCTGCREARTLMAAVAQSVGQATGFAVASGLGRSDARGMVRTRTGRAVQFLPTAIDPHGVLARVFGVRALPTLLVIDRAGRVAARLEQPPAAEDLQATLDDLTAEPIPADVDPPTRPRLSVFDAPARPVGGLPRTLRPTTAPCPYAPGSMRRIGGDGGARFLVARTLDGGLLVATIDAQGVGVGCGVAQAPSLRARELRRIARRGIVTALGSQARDRDPVYALVVLDGYDEAVANGSVFAIRRNGVVITGVGRATYVTLRGPAGSRRVRIFG